MVPRGVRLNCALILNFVNAHVRTCHVMRQGARTLWINVQPSQPRFKLNIIAASSSTDHEVPAASLVLTDGSQPVQRLCSRPGPAGSRRECTSYFQRGESESPVLDCVRLCCGASRKQRPGVSPLEWAHSPNRSGQSC